MASTPTQHELSSRAATSFSMGRITRPIIAGVAPNTASGHLSKLIAAGMVTVEAKGRNRYYSLSSHQVAEALEAIEALATTLVPRHRPRSPHDEAIRFARCCYDHLAGNVGVRLVEGLTALKYIERTPDGFNLQKKGENAFVSLGVDIDALKTKRRRLIRCCPDWSERSAHLGGALGSALFDKFCILGWIKKQRDSRAVTVTQKGKAALQEHFRMGF